MKKKKVKLLGNRARKKKRIVIECTPDQALLIEESLEAVSRFCMGQIDHFLNYIEIIRHKWFSLEKFKVEEIIKPVLFPELQKNESYGVGNKAIGDAQILYEMLKILQNYRAKNLEHPGVLANSPLHYSKEPLITVKEIPPSNSTGSFGKAGDTYI